jgi:hypothetical protein
LCPLLHTFIHSTLHHRSPTTWTVNVQIDEAPNSRSRPHLLHKYNDPTLMNWLRGIRVLFDSEHGASDRLGARWLFLRALGGIYFSAFISLVFQIRGLIGPDGILPANKYLLVAFLWIWPRIMVCTSGAALLSGIHLETRYFATTTRGTPHI